MQASLAVRLSPRSALPATFCRIVCRNTVNRPLLLVFPQMCVKPRKLNVSGFPVAALCRVVAANGRIPAAASCRDAAPDRTSRIVHASSVRNRSASARRWNPNHEVVGEAHDDHVTVRVLPSPLLGPQVEHIVQIDVRQQRRCTAALGRPRPSLRIRCPSSSTPAFSHFWMSRTTRWSAIRCSTNFTSHPWSRVSKEPTDVRIEHPVHLLRHDSDVERVQRVVRAASRPEPVREAEKVRLVDGVQHLDRRALDDLVFQRGHTERPLPPVGLRDVRPANRLRPVRSPLQPLGELLEVALQVLAVVPPRLAVHARRRVSLECEVRRSQRVRRRTRGAGAR